MTHDPLSGEPAPDALAKRRFMAIQLVRLSGVALVMLGLLVINGKIDLPAVAGYVLLVVGLGDIFVMPQLLAKRWKSPPP